ncbi:YbaB/EbfC family nucleoid-associated protein [Stackebrandtia nassauensis]|uniref:YbaB/EbfC DNA-binding family protein n=1 Tax=Stackebrandtia nassauensis (strain DSM 44728 / CIP 108903 / NRRL B-16338 / NBRC 102104 / LLR-40K-21) TaxID=446470 RepID=D3PYU3_STANL|nr:YbaB/EbfC family nucleoid-associated protein [Stackebrandtia nassauensis]ADD43526.1 hypothetical protein Snas_3871 [Stackebrandtia nassauensis DSM 44728]
MTVNIEDDAMAEVDPHQALAESEAADRAYLRKLDEHVVTARDANGLVTVTSFATGEVKDVEISARRYAALSREDLADAVLEAWRNARTEANAAAKRLHESFVLKQGGET